MNIPEDLIKKYNVPAPRYTSYPTVPFWKNDNMPGRDWLSVVKRTFTESNDKEGISIYIHLPYCESLCTYCACNTRITKNHAVESTYITFLLKEWQIYLANFPEKPIIRELHLGGGTPTFFSPENLNRLIQGILDTADIHHAHSFSFEGHPNNTTKVHLQCLYDLGFRRVSYGVQDLDIKVQQTINREQPYENVKKAMKDARAIGYGSVNFDLIYGLPFQTADSVTNTVEKVIGLAPDRIAFYSYAHVPWQRPGQRAYSDHDLPDNATKRKLYEVGKAALLKAGYIDIGMDHFALKGDELYTAYQCKTMHRNFMGYTTAQTDLLIGLGASAISDAKYAYAQNKKKVEEYREEVDNGLMTLEKGHFLTNDDIKTRRLILDIACGGEVKWTSYGQMLDINMNISLLSMAEDGLIKLFDTGLRVTDLGMAFLRNICVVFDKYLQQNKQKEQAIFSKAI